MKKLSSILLIIISLNVQAQDSTKIFGLPLQARLIEYLAPSMSNIDNDSLYTTFLDLRTKFRAAALPILGTTTFIIDSIPTVELANLYNYTLSNSDGMGVSNMMRANILPTRTANSFLNTLCSNFETIWQNKMIALRKSGRRLLLGK